MLRKILKKIIKKIKDFFVALDKAMDYGLRNIPPDKLNKFFNRFFNE